MIECKHPIKKLELHTGNHSKSSDVVECSGIARNGHACYKYRAATEFYHRDKDSQQEVATVIVQLK